MVSLDSSGSLVMAASISATKTLVGILGGVGANLGPLFKMARSSEVSGLLERLMTHFDESIIGPADVDSLLRFFNFCSSF